MTGKIKIDTFDLKKTVEMVERKGIGHPDTICDFIAESISVSLCKYYLDEFGCILHHNVDKALLVGGESSPAFGGGKILQPMELYVAGRATSNVKGKQIPVNEIVVDTAKKWIDNNLRYLDVENHIKIIPKIRSGSNELVELFQRFGKGEAPLANDSSFGVGYYPYSVLEKNVLDISALLDKKDTKENFPFVGEDIKVMGVSMSEMTKITIAIAMVDKFTADINSYKANIEKIKSFIKSELKLSNCEIFINTADDFEKESIYLTVTGTSAEGGDDGQVGRGNRVNGLITPYRPMSLEAYAGKNPVSHVGKIYNLFSYELSRSICENKYAEEAQVYIVSQIGKPITEPQILHIKLKNKSVDFKLVENLSKEMLGDIPNIWKRITGLNDFT